MLPRLLYLADVPVEASYHGSALVYRLLQPYPADRLKVVESNLFQRGTDRRLPGVGYATLDAGRSRLQHSRFHDWYSRWLLFRAPTRVKQLPGLLLSFVPDAVITVAHGYTWLTAARYAADANLPLHLIIHDDWPRVAPAATRHAVERAFARVYQQAKSRFCISPYMAEEYERRYGQPGTVLLPSRAPGVTFFRGHADRLDRAGTSTVFAFAGTINSPGYARLLRDLAHQLDRSAGRLLIYGPLTQAQADAAGLAQPHVQLMGMLPPRELLSRLRDEVDVLFVPMSFAPEDRANMRMAFPSKLTDYTSVGLPMLICGPPDCSAVRWARDNPGVAEVVATDDAAALGAAIDRLCGERERRIALATTAQRIGDRDFSAEKAEAILHDALVA